MPYLIYSEKFNLSTFILICFLQGMLSGVLLCLVMYSTVNVAIKGIRSLIEHYTKKRNKSKDKDKFHRLYLKLKAFRTGFLLHTALISIVTLPNMFPSLNSTKVMKVVWFSIPEKVSD
eukprot:snap_masked-scaffold_28-processed-gene-1.9-mRNA-1 protein AED:1.00 eAED:1.00 QI:0/0/0/0/1/1/2/0/117